jgi:hypothetical protein
MLDTSHLRSLRPILIIQLHRHFLERGHAAASRSAKEATAALPAADANAVLWRLTAERVAAAAPLPALTFLLVGLHASDMDARLVTRATVVPEEAKAFIFALASADAVVHVVPPNIPKFEGARRHESTGC